MSRREVGFLFLIPIMPGIVLGFLIYFVAIVVFGDYGG